MGEGKPRRKRGRGKHSRKERRKGVRGEKGDKEYIDEKNEEN